MIAKVSFITGIKNRSKELAEMIQSLIDQDMPEWEAIIVDDHSEEDVESVVKSFDDPRISFFKLDQDKHGICHARNLAISHATSEIMLTADGDDVNRPHRARLTYDTMMENKADVFYANLEYFIAEENKKWIPDFQPFNEELLKMFNFMTGPATAYRKDICLKVGGYDPEFTLSEDYDLWLRMLSAGGKFVYSTEIVANYRRNPESVSIKNFSKMHDFIMKTRIKNNIAPFDIRDAAKYAIAPLAKNILSENGLNLWRDDRFNS
jgi:glycosyltransferase involved in cell wall biosynthesis